MAKGYMDSKLYKINMLCRLDKLYKLCYNSK